MQEQYKERKPYQSIWLMAIPERYAQIQKEQKAEKKS